MEAVNARKVIDRFHVQRLALDALQEIRIRHRWDAIDAENIAKTTAKAPETALPKLALWYNHVMDAGFKEFQSVADTIQANYGDILNFFENRATNASAESFNSKVKSFRAQLRGVSDTNYFLYRLAKIYA